jgi:hypothetical protein
MDLSTEVLDHILASDFTLADHLALMGTCRALRRVYTCEVLLELLMLSNYGSNVCALLDRGTTVSRW